MHLSLSTGILLQSISVLLALVTIVFFLVKGKSTPLLRSYIWCQILIFIWSLGQIFQLLSPTPMLENMFIRIEYFSICFIGFAWLVFSLWYTNSMLAFNKKITAGLAFLPVIFYITLLTNDFHNLFYKVSFNGMKAYGLVFWLHTVVAYTYLAVGTGLIVKYAIQRMGYERKQSILLVMAVSIPFAANIIYLTKNVQSEVDITPVTFAISLLLFSLATFRYRFLNIVPIAFRKIVDNMKEAVIVIDNSNRIVNFNDSFSKTFIKEGQLRINDDIARFVDLLKADIEEDSDTEKFVFAVYNLNIVNFSGELSLQNSGGKTFAVNIQAIYGKNKELLGRIISYNDISEYKKLLEQLNDQNHELTAVNDQLKEYAATVEELAIEKERNRFARDIHDTLGHSMTLLIALMEVGSITCRKDPAKTEEKLAEAIKIARDGLKELRRSISGLTTEKLESGNLLIALNKLVSDFRRSGVNVEFTAEGLESVNDHILSDVVFRTCQEAMTNSLRHGKAKNISAITKVSGAVLKLFIFDDGCGCKSISKGYGLTGMEHRINSIGGKIVYGSDGESGFNIRAEIPLKEE